MKKEEPQQIVPSTYIASLPRLSNEHEATVKSPNSEMAKNNNQTKQQQSQSVSKRQSKGQNDSQKLQVNLRPKFQFITKDSDKDMESITWNVLQSEAMGGAELQRVAWNLFFRKQWLKDYEISNQSFAQFLNIMETKYNKKGNPFHNFTHGIGVMQCVYALTNCERAQQHLDNFDIFCLTFSGLCHDVSHPAHTNNFAINSLSKLAIRYHDVSPLEQHHTATTFKICKKLDLFKNMSPDVFKSMRKKVISNILYTDNFKHQRLLEEFEVRTQGSAPQIFGKSPDDINLLSGMIIHTADFVGAAKPFEISKTWSHRVNLEFAKQYELEGQIGITQTPFMKDLDKIHVMAKAEIGFFKFLVIPLWLQMNHFLDDHIKDNVQYLRNAVEEWQKIHEENKPQN